MSSSLNTPDSSCPPPQVSRSACWILLFLYFLSVVRTAWLGDDSYNTFRTVDNFLNGYGLRWNVAERVQVYTHPLWMLALIPGAWLTGEVYFSSLFLSVAASVFAVWYLVRHVTIENSTALVILLILLSSHAFIDYSTSGLENPLSHVLLVLYAGIFFRTENPSKPKVPGLAFLMSLLILTRHDLALLVVPSFAYAFYKEKSVKTLYAAMLGFLPFIIWTFFSLLYYGFPFPNTAYAKLNTGIPSSELVQQGLLYFLASVEHDPLTLAALAGVTLVSLVSKNLSFRMIGFGTALYCLYILRVGGDFMEGRFFTAPLLFGLCFLGRLTHIHKATLLTAAAACVLLGFAGRSLPLLSSSSYTNTEVRPSYIQDERGQYYLQTGLLRLHHRNQKMPANSAWADQGRADFGQKKIISRGAVGFYGYCAGPAVHIIDIYALGDPLLSRLPVSNPEAWQIGHYLRHPSPKGYEVSIEKNENHIGDPELKKLYEHVRRVTRGPIFSIRRLKSILFLNFGAYKKLIPERWWALES